MTHELITLKDRPTHRLSIKLDDGSYRTFYLNERQAEFLAKGINGADRFIVLPKDVDADAPQFYPKTWATLERMSDAEIEARSTRYREAVKTEQEKTDEAQRKNDQAAVRTWIDEHETEFNAMKAEAEKKLKASPGMFHAASAGTKTSLIYWEAMRAAYALVLKK